MEHLDYVEHRAADTIKVLRDSYDHLHERVFKFASLLLAGGGGVGAFSLGKIGQPAITWAPLAALAVFWFATAALLMWKGATSNRLSPGNGPAHMLEYFKDRLAESQDAAAALEVTRRAELDLQQSRIKRYIDACNTRSSAIDLAYKVAAIGSPVVALVVATLCAVER